jgi:S-adenosylmethionine:tRNA ribosyltransferase-isomerase
MAVSGLLELLDYALPEAQIAQEPLADRDGARLLVMRRGAADFSHRGVRDLPTLLSPALFVLNDTRVFCARLRGHKPSGGRAELLLLERIGEPGEVERWRALGKANKRLEEGARLILGDGTVSARVMERHDQGELVVVLETADGVEAALSRVGEVPLPPYIRRASRDSDLERYQTIFAREDGAVAAPTAGLHLSKALFSALANAGHEIAYVTLHVGPGTFAPVKAARIEDHVMHAERYVVPEATAVAIERTHAEGRPVVAVGTTVVRTLETVAEMHGAVVPTEGETRLFILPGHPFRVVDALFTNFHLPRSTLLALVMAFGGIESVRSAYAAAVAGGYRFFSYGDAMLIQPS